MLNVFKDLELMNFNIDNKSNTLNMEIMPKPNYKIDLSSSLILQGLNRLKDKYKHSY